MPSNKDTHRASLALALVTHTYRSVSPLRPMRSPESLIKVRLSNAFHSLEAEHLKLGALYIPWSTVCCLEFSCSQV
jgi:hypothetical protein